MRDKIRTLIELFSRFFSKSDVVFLNTTVKDTIYERAKTKSKESIHVASFENKRNLVKQLIHSAVGEVKIFINTSFTEEAEIHNDYQVLDEILKACLRDVAVQVIVTDISKMEGMLKMSSDLSKHYLNFDLKIYYLNNNENNFSYTSSFLIADDGVRILERDHVKSVGNFNFPEIANQLRKYFISIREKNTFEL